MSNIPQLTDASLELENRVAILTFRRDDVRNALTGTALIDDIVQVAAWTNLNRVGMIQKCAPGSKTRVTNTTS